MTARIADPALEPPITLEDRDLIIPDELRIIGVAHDNWAEKVHFEFPTSFDENSWQGKLIYIDFMNAGGESDTQPILESTIEDGVLKFAWEIDNRFTRYNGTARFAVRITSSDGYRFGTKISAVEISEGIYVESEIDAETTSRLEQWEARIAELIDDASTTSSKVNGLADSYTKNISQLTNTTAQANEAIAKANTAIDRATEAYNNTLKEPITEDNYLNGIRYLGEKFHGKCSRSGIEVMHITGKTTQERTNGYQLFDMSLIPSKEANGVKFFNNGDGSYSVFGTSTNGNYSSGTSYMPVPQIFKRGPLYTSSNENLYPYALCKFLDSNNVTLKELNSRLGGSIDLTDELLADGNRFQYLLYGPQAETANARSFKPMFYQDGDGTYETFTGGKPGPNPDYPLPLKSFEANKVVVMGKNVAKYKKGISQNGGVFEQLEDGTIVIKATGTGPYSPGLANVGGELYKANKGNLIPIPDGSKNVYAKMFDGVVDSCYVGFYDKFKHYVGGGQIKMQYGIPYDAHYLIISYGVNNATVGQTYTDRVMVSFEPITEWVPPHYEEIELPEPLILRGLPDGTSDEYMGDGVVKRNCKYVRFDGSETWTIDGPNAPRAFTDAFDMKRLTNYTNAILCNRGLSALYHGNLASNAVKDNEVVSGYSSGNDNTTYPGQNWIYINFGVGTTSAEIKDYVKAHPMDVIYPLAVPTFETYPMPILPSWDDEVRAFFVSETETDIEWRPCAIGDRSKEIQKLEEKITDLESEIVELKTASVNSETAG